MINFDAKPYCQLIKVFNGLFLFRILQLECDCFVIWIYRKENTFEIIYGNIVRTYMVHWCSVSLSTACT